MLSVMTLIEAQAITGKLSEPSKMPGYAFAIPATLCLTGGKLRGIEGSVCNKCYAMAGFYRYPNVIKSLTKRLKAVEHPLWVEAMALHISTLETSGYFRWFASGDLQSLGMLVKICEVCRRTPKIKHWLSTREVGILHAFNNAGFKYPDNLVVRLSATMIEDKPNTSTLKSLKINGSAVSKEKWNCPSSAQDNMCKDCRKCWWHSIPIVTYRYH